VKSGAVDGVPAKLRFCRLRRTNIWLLIKIGTSFLDSSFFVTYATRTAFQTAQKKMAVKSFSTEARAEALQLLKDGLPQKDVAEQIGCSIASLQSWKQQARGKKNGKKKKTKSTKKVAAVEADAERNCGCCNCVPFEDFVHDYWTKCPKAGEVLKLPPDMMPEAIKYVNNVLKYAYGNLCGK